MKSIFLTLFGVGIGLTLSYLFLTKKETEETENLPLFVFRKPKGSINDEVFAGVKENENETWL